MYFNYTRWKKHLQTHADVVQSLYNDIKTFKFI